MGETTMRDVARVAQVSVASVSRALNGLANVHVDTRYPRAGRMVQVENETGTYANVRDNSRGRKAVQRLRTRSPRPAAPR